MNGHKKNLPKMRFIPGGTRGEAGLDTTNNNLSTHKVKFLPTFLVFQKESSQKIIFFVAVRPDTHKKRDFL
jgi:hypothetical protein